MNKSIIYGIYNYYLLALLKIYISFLLQFVKGVSSLIYSIYTYNLPQEIFLACIGET